MSVGADHGLVSRQRQALNVNARRGSGKADLLLLHYTGVDDAERAVDWLTREESQVSCHYLIDEAGLITQMVDEGERAWHAGASHWAGDTDINSCSIGIEIHNPGHDLGYRDFPPEQMRAVIALCRDIVDRQQIVPWRVLAHSDVAPARKADPGERFPWGALAEAGIGLWLEPMVPEDDRGLGPDEAGGEVGSLQLALWQLGYGLSVTGHYDRMTELCVTAFQRHWRPAKVDGRADRSTRQVLADLRREMHRCVSEHAVRPRLA